jgi:hypothetical protein
MVGGSLRVLRLLPPLKTGRHDIAEILLKVALNKINQIKLTIGICELFTFQSFLKTLGPLKPNLTGMLIRWSFTKF